MEFGLYFLFAGLVGVFVIGPSALFIMLAGGLIILAQSHETLAIVIGVSVLVFFIGAQAALSPRLYEQLREMTTRRTK